MQWGASISETPAIESHVQNSKLITPTDLRVFGEADKFYIMLLKKRSLSKMGYKTASPAPIHHPAGCSQPGKIIISGHAPKICKMIIN